MDPGGQENQRFSSSSEQVYSAEVEPHPFNSMFYMDPGGVEPPNTRCKRVSLPLAYGS